MTNTIPWTSYDLIFFDCDSTLSAIEGIDELARFKGKAWRVSVLTQKAMEGELDLSDVYGKRLQAIRPTRGQLKAIEERYWETMVPDAQAVINALKYLGKQVFIISGGLAEPVRGFGVRLGVPAEHIRAVQLEYNELSGNWWRYYEPSEQASQSYLDFDEGPLTVSNGKSAIIRELTRERRGRIMMIGDGSSDLATRAVVDLFVGFGGVVARETVKDKADVFVQVKSLASIVPLACGSQGYVKTLDTPHQTVFERGLAHIRDQEVLMRNDLKQAFEKEFQRNED
ncbi:MAG: HAD-IB family phosphatase [Anaerolineae bacterium]|nr:HAD-IB family phosphatase [Anaerolineae bacterium]